MASPVVSSSASAFISTTQKLDNWVVCNPKTHHSKFNNKKHGCIYNNIYTYIDKTLLKLSSSSSTTRCGINAIPTNTISSSSLFSSSSSLKRHWLVVMDNFHLQGLHSRPEIIDYFVKTIQTVLGNEEDAEMCLYDASCETHFGFCCEVDEDMAREIARLPGVLSVRPDPDFHIVRKDPSYYKVQQDPPSSSSDGNSWLNPLNSSKHWLVRTETPLVGVMGKAQVVDYYVEILSKVLGNEKDAQMCMYNVSWQSNFGFYCELDDVCAHELAGVPGVISVQPDETLDSENKQSGGENILQSTGSADSLATADTKSIGTKKLFVTGLSFYTSEKTLRAAFEGFGEIVEVRIIMDKISKRSKGYAFIEYTTEAAASAALKEMNGKIINGWMIVVDVAKKNPPKYGSARRSSI